MEKVKQYIVFERPEGSLVWTIAFERMNGPAVFHKKEHAQEWVKVNQDIRKGWRNGVPGQVPMRFRIITVELPK